MIIIMCVLVGWLGVSVAAALVGSRISRLATRDPEAAPSRPVLAPPAARADARMSLPMNMSLFDGADRADVLRLATEQEALRQAAAQDAIRELPASVRAALDSLMANQPVDVVTFGPGSVDTGTQPEPRPVASATQLELLPRPPQPIVAPAAPAAPPSAVVDLAARRAIRTKRASAVAVAAAISLAGVGSAAAANGDLPPVVQNAVASVVARAGIDVPRANTPAPADLPDAAASTADVAVSKPKPHRPEHEPAGAAPTAEGAAETGDAPDGPETSAAAAEGSTPSTSATPATPADPVAPGDGAQPATPSDGADPAQPAEPRHPADAASGDRPNAERDHTSTASRQNGHADTQERSAEQSSAAALGASGEDHGASPQSDTKP